MVEKNRVLQMRYFAPRWVVCTAVTDDGDEYSRLFLDIVCRRRTTCQFCDAPLELVHNRTWWNDDVRELIDACPACGWWCLSEIHTKLVRPRMRLACLARYNITPFQQSIYPLLQCLKNDRNLIYQLSPKQFELAVASVLRGLFDCDVSHVGKAGDGGVDVLLLSSDSDPIVVQVKRHENPNAVEGVSVIRELRGAMVLADASRGIFVSTAQRYSRPAEEAAGKIKGTSTLQQIKLVNCQKFLDLLNLAVPAEAPVPSWFLFNFNDGDSVGDVLRDTYATGDMRTGEDVLTEAYRKCAAKPVSKELGFANMFPLFYGTQPRPPQGQNIRPTDQESEG